MSAVRRRDADALIDRCAAGCHRYLVPYTVRPDAPGMVIAQYACRCGALWELQWPAALLPAGSPLRGSS